MTEFQLSKLMDPNFRSKISNYVDQYMVFVDYVPFVGPLYNVSYALNLLLNIWRGGSEDDSNKQNKQSARIAREKGVVAVVTAVIDLITLCLAIGVMAYVCDNLTRITTWTSLRNLLLLFILSNIATIAAGLKILVSQLGLQLTRQLEDVNHVGTSMVKSVTITASAIENIVQTTNSTTSRIHNRIMSIYNFIAYYVMMVVMAPVKLFESLRLGVSRIGQLLKRKLRIIRLRLRNFFFTIYKLFLRLFFIF